MQHFYLKECIVLAIIYRLALVVNGCHCRRKNLKALFFYVLYINGMGLTLFIHSILLASMKFYFNIEFTVPVTCKIWGFTVHNSVGNFQTYEKWAWLITLWTYSVFDSYYSRQRKIIIIKLFGLLILPYDLKIHGYELIVSFEVPQPSWNV